MELENFIIRSDQGNIHMTFKNNPFFFFFSLCFLNKNYNFELDAAEFQISDCDAYAERSHIADTPSSAYKVKIWKMKVQTLIKLQTLT